MVQLDLKKNLSVKVKTDILVYLESRPLKEVYSLFTSIVTELQDNGIIDQRSNDAVTGSGNPSVGSDSIHAVEDEQRDRGIKSRNKSFHRGNV